MTPEGFFFSKLLCFSICLVKVVYILGKLIYHLKLKKKNQTQNVSV